MTTFGKIPTYQGTEKMEFAVSDDRQALTLTFGDFTASVGGAGSKVPIASRLFNFVVPLEGYDKHVEAQFTVQGAQALEAGSSATLVCSVNGQTVATDFTPDTDLSIVQTLKFAADGASECRLSILLLVGRDAKSPAPQGQMNVSSVDVAILPPAGKQAS